MATSTATTLRLALLLVVGGWPRVAVGQVTLQPTAPPTATCFGIADDPFCTVLFVPADCQFEEVSTPDQAPPPIGTL
jgi:hypothetical protein